MKSVSHSRRILTKRFASTALVGLFLAALIWVADFAKAQTPTPPPGVIETYKVVNGMSIRATVYNVEDGQRHRVVIVIHGGGYSGGTMQTNVAQDAFAVWIHGCSD